MQLNQILADLYREKAAIEQTIANLEALNEKQPAQPAGNRRGRKSMGAAERLEVAARMKRYWAGRRKAAQ